MIVHVVLLLCLMVLGLLHPKSPLNREEEKAKARTAAKRAKIRTEKKRAERQTRKLSSEHRKQLKRSAERKPQAALAKDLAALKKLRREIRAVKQVRLKIIEARTLEEVQAAQVRKFEQQAAVAQQTAKNRLAWHKEEIHRRVYDEITEAMAMAKGMQEDGVTPQEARKLAQLTAKMADAAADAIRQAGNKAPDADVSEHALVRQAQSMAASAA